MKLGLLVVNTKTSRANPSSFGTGLIKIWDKQDRSGSPEIEVNWKCDEEDYRLLTPEMPSMSA